MLNGSFLLKERYRMNKWKTSEFLEKYDELLAKTEFTADDEEFISFFCLHLASALMHDFDKEIAVTVANIIKAHCNKE